MCLSVCEIDVYVCIYAYACTHIRYECVFMCMHRHTHTEQCSEETQKASFPLHNYSSSQTSKSTAPCSAVRMENSIRGSARSGVSHCLTNRDRTMMILRGRFEELLDPALCSSEFRGMEELPAARPVLAPKCSIHLSLPQMQFVFGGKNYILGYLVVFCCFSFNILWVMCYFPPC